MRPLLLRRLLFFALEIDVFFEVCCPLFAVVCSEICGSIEVYCPVYRVDFSLCVFVVWLIDYSVLWSFFFCCLCCFVFVVVFSQSYLFCLHDLLSNQ